jgi:hypothetical protein
MGQSIEAGFPVTVLKLCHEHDGLKSRLESERSFATCVRPSAVDDAIV